MPHNYPLLLDVADRLIVIVGGGDVAVRKAQGLIDAGATRVRVVSPRLHDRMPHTVQHVSETYRPEHLGGAGLVFAATDDPQVNDAVVRDAKSMNVLVCRADADDENAGDFATPAVIRRGSVLVTVSTGGSPALAAKLRDSVQQKLDQRFVKMAELMQTLRRRIHAVKSLAPSRRRELFRVLASDEAMKLLDESGEPALLQWIKQRYPEMNDLR
jgi:precorrin-2 dehydrogenase/sirohydrochlorin ferrochelatase